MSQSKPYNLIFGRFEYMNTHDISPHLHLDEHHGGYLLGRKEPVFSRDADLYVRLVVLLLHHKWPVLDVFLHSGVVPVAADQSLYIKDGVLRVQRQLVLGCVSDQPLAVRGEGHVGGSDAVPLVVGNDLDTSILVHTNTARDGGMEGGGEKGGENIKQ